MKFRPNTSGYVIFGEKTPEAIARAEKSLEEMRKCMENCQKQKSE
ncbi:hypothetical protein ACFL1B_01115 [Nanoarchaeota archaeon]